MKPLIILLAVFAASSLVSRLIAGNWNITFGGNLAMCVMLCFTALGHFLFVKGMTMMMPPFIPFKTGMIYLTGVAEVIFALALLFPASRPYAGYALIVFFILLLPANIFAALKHVNIEKGTFDGPGLSYLWFRIPLQLFFIAWIWFFSIR